MKNKQLIIFILFSSLVSLSFGQTDNDYSISFTTAKGIGEEIRISVHADGVIRPYIWIDLNNNGVREPGEDVQTFDQWRDGNTPTYTVGAETITVHGRISQFGVEGGELTSIDFSNASQFVRLWLADNNLESIDLSGQTGGTNGYLNILRLSRNQLKGALDLSHLGVNELHLDRNNLEHISIKERPQMTYLNISRNLLTEEGITSVLNGLGTRVGYSAGNLYVVDTRAVDPEYREGNQLRQHHLEHRNLNWGDNVGLNWQTRDMNPAVGIFHDISAIMDSYKLSFTTAKSQGENITLNIDADADDRSGIWIDLNANETKDDGEVITTFGSDVSYTVSSPNISVYGVVSKILASNNELTAFDSSRNPFLTTIDLSDNMLQEISLLSNQPLSEVNIAENRITASEIDDILGTLINRNNTTQGTLTLLNFDEDLNDVSGEHILRANSKNWVVKDTSGRVLLPTDIGDVFSWLEVPTIAVMGDYAVIVGPEVEVAQYTKFYINNNPAELMIDRVDLSEYEGNLSLKATSGDGSQVIRLVVER